MMRNAVLLVAGLVPQLVAARYISARQTINCDFSTAANSGDTCSSFAADWGLSLAQFEAINPGTPCDGPLTAGDNYCVIGEVVSSTTSTTTTTTTTTSPTKSTTTTTTSKTTTTTTTPKPTTTTTTKTTTTTTTTSTGGAPGPTQPGLASNCNKYYKVVSGDQCGAIETQYGITAAQFAAWNPYIDSNCGNLWVDYYVCVGVPGSTTPPSKTTTTPASSPTGSGPSPQMPGIISTCNKYYQVASGDGCYAIEQAQGISSSQFLAWNTQVDAQCDNLWLGYYVCVGVSGGSPTTPAQPTKTTPTSTGPSPQMPSITSSCKSFYQVASGDSCYTIEQAKSISSSQFLSWNKYVDANCDNLWLGYYVCVGV